ncbi:hypothetical protein [Caballeronia sp. BCC1704]|uniref:hypothetical protein n=1 Tax=Caballeronia sp. BCC1704 TaxID=2676300 RepID=UPI0015885914|nr:hypothetical protein [Caballeronia sp. BCC1704]
MEACQTVDLIVAISRATVLVIATCGGIMSIALGWKLYKDVILSKTEGSFKAGGWTIKLAGAGPGVFFVAFGVWLLVKIVGQQVELKISNIDRPTVASARNSRLLEDLRLLSASRSSQPDVVLGIQLISDEKCPSTNACPVCLLPKSHIIRFFDGPKVLTNEMARSALKTAEKSLEMQSLTAQNANSPLAGVNLVEQVEVLKQMRLLIPPSSGD